MKKRVVFIWIFLICMMVAQVANAEVTVPVANPGFELGQSNQLEGWTSMSWDTEKDATVITRDTNVYRTGSASLSIVNRKYNHSRVLQKLSVESGKIYRIQCWVKSEDIDNGAIGANISVDGYGIYSNQLKGTSTQWEQLLLYGKAVEGQTSVVLTFGIGGYSSINRGKAWFDDVSVVQVDQVPSEIAVVDLGKVDVTKETVQVGGDGVQGTPLIYFGFFLCVIFVFYGIRIGKTRSEGTGVLYVAVFCVIAAFIRLIIAMNTQGHYSDMQCFKSWALNAARDLTQFYKPGYFADYPPGYIYILGLVGKMINAIGADLQGQIVKVLEKTPAMIADIATGVLFYRVAAAKGKEKLGVMLAALYIFNPLVIFNSAVWGQVDSFFTIFILLAVIELKEERLLYSAMFYTLAVLIKPQGIIFLPIMFFKLVKDRSALDFLKVIGVGLLTTVIVIIPFSIHQEPLWIIKLYMRTISEYPYGSVNAFNLFGLLGANWVEAKNSIMMLGVNLVISYKLLGLLFIIACTLFVGYLSEKSRNATVVIFSSMLLITGVFVLASGMHERYLFPAFALSLLGYLYIGEIRILVAGLLLSITGLANVAMVYDSYWKGLAGPAMHSPLVIFICLTNLLVFGWLVKLGFELYARREDEPMELELNKELTKDSTFFDRDETEESQK